MKIKKQGRKLCHESDCHEARELVFYGYRFLMEILSKKFEISSAGPVLYRCFPVESA